MEIVLKKTSLLEKSKALDLARCKWEHIAHAVNQNFYLVFKSCSQCVIKQMNLL